MGRAGQEQEQKEEQERGQGRSRSKSSQEERDTPLLESQVKLAKFHYLGLGPTKNPDTPLLLLLHRRKWQLKLEHSWSR